MSTIDAGTYATFTAPDNSVWGYYQDADIPSYFYVMPVATIAQVNGQPGFHLTTYKDPKGDFVAATLQLTTMLAPPPPAVVSGIQQVLSTAGVSQPMAQAMPWLDTGAPGSPERNQAFLSFASADGLVSRTASVVPSLSGSENAVFTLVDLSADEVAFLQRYFGGDTSAGTVNVVYELTLTAHLGGITAHVHFDASTAYTFQQTFAWVS